MTAKEQREHADTLITSDWHLKSWLCKIKAIEGMLASFSCRQIVLGGDIVDDDMQTVLEGDYLGVMNQLKERAGSDCEIYYVRGNHDAKNASAYASLIGAKVCDEYCWQYNGKQFRVIHGDQFDVYWRKNPFKSAFGSNVLYWIQYVCGSRADRLCRFFKRNAWGYARARKCVAYRALRHARRKHDDYIICGHTHHLEHWQRKNRHYYNTGCATEYPATCITVCEKGIRFQHFDAQGKLIHTERPPQ